MQNIFQKIQSSIQNLVGRLRGSTPNQSFTPTSLDRNGRRRTRLLMTLVIIVLVIAALVGAISFATPASPFYTIKTNVVEKIGSSLRVGTQAKAEYQVSLLESRLEETRRLAGKGEVSEDTLNRLADQTEKNVVAMRTLLESDEEYDATAVFNTIRDASAVLKAMEITVEESEVMTPIVERVEDFRQHSDSTRRDLAYLIIATQDDEHLQAYINEELGNLSKAIERANLSEGALDEVTRYMERMENALKRNNAVNVIESVSDALQVIRVEEYLGRA